MCVPPTWPVPLRWRSEAPQSPPEPLAAPEWRQPLRGAVGRGQWHTYSHTDSCISAFTWKPSGCWPAPACRPRGSAASSTNPSAPSLIEPQLSMCAPQAIPQPADLHPRRLRAPALPPHPQARQSAPVCCSAPVAGQVPAAAATAAISRSGGASASWGAGWVTSGPARYKQQVRQCQQSFPLPKAPPLSSPISHEIHPACLLHQQG